MQRWLMLLAAATVLLAALGALFALLHQADSRDTVTLALPGDPPAEQAPATPAPAAPESVSGSADPSALAAVPPEAQPVTPPVSAPAALPPGSVVAPPASGQVLANRPVSAAAGASYKLMIKPWGMVQVDGVDRGASPPLKRLVLAPGQHTIRIVNPNFPEHTVIVNAVKGATSVIELDFTEEEVE